MAAAIIVHGGAGELEESRRERCIAGCVAAAAAGWRVLDGGGAALDAVELAVRALEDDEEFNAGYGAVLTRDGRVEVDACVMLAADANRAVRAGAVGAVPWLRHPVTLARHVLEDGEHVLVVGEGALAFAREHGILPEPPASLVAPRARQRFDRRGDTVGACAVDGAGNLAVASSTGGIAGKRSGRVGDTPLVGAGSFAAAGVGAATATGHGESILRVLMSHFAVDRLRAGDSAAMAARAAVADLVARTGSTGGIIVIDKEGHVGHHTATASMPWAAIAGGVASSGAAP